LVAILMQALSPLTEERHAAKRRNELAIASIINLRRDFGYRAESAFGQFLAHFRVSHPVNTISLQGWHGTCIRTSRSGASVFSNLARDALTGAI
jgi:hypothetical protein